MCLKWYSIIEKCCKKRHFEVNRMNSVNFKSTKPLLNAITNRKICSDGQKVRWLDIQWIRIQKDKPFVMQFKCSMNDDLAFSCVSLAKRGRPRSLAVVNLHCTRAVVLSKAVSKDKKLSYRRGTARCVVSIEILSIATQQCRNYYTTSPDQIDGMKLEI